MTDEVLLRSELLERLGGRHAVDRALAAGAWQRVLRGTYAPGDAVLDLGLRSRAAQRLLPEHAHVADRCLLWLLGIDVLPPGPPQLEVVVPRDAVPSRRADAVQHAALCAAPQLREELATSAGLRGIVQARRALELSDARAESPPESRLRLAFVLAGLRPVPQHVVLDEHGRFVARVDLAFPELRIAVEYDGRAVHEREDVFARDRRRQNDLVRAGWTVLRSTAADLRWGASYVVAQVLALAAA